jgi:hypothetical protein
MRPRTTARERRVTLQVEAAAELSDSLDVPTPRIEQEAIASALGTSQQHVSKLCSGANPTSTTLVDCVQLHERGFASVAVHQLSWAAGKCGHKLVPVASSSGDLNDAAADLSEAMGALVARLVRARRADSDGGEALSEAERAALRPLIERGEGMLATLRDACGASVRVLRRVEGS